MDWLENINPEYVLILSGDHIYRCNFNEMLEIHKKNKADVTIAALEVTLEEARRFGILSVDENDRITEFAEKPKILNQPLLQWVFIYLIIVCFAIV